MASLSRAAQAATALLLASDGFYEAPPTVSLEGLEDAKFSLFSSDPYKPTIEVLAPPYRNVQGDACVVALGAHEFFFSYGTPWATSFPQVTTCDLSTHSVAYLKYQASSPLGVQFDRIGAVWINGVELLRTSTEEPDRKSGVTWEIARDVSLYRDVVAKGGDVVVALDNVIDGPYNSSFAVTLSLEFFTPLDAAHEPRRPDLIVPVSKNTTSYGWFTVEPSSTSRGDNSALVQVPANTEELYLELFLSHHQCDEFWYGNPPDEFAKANGICGSGPFREVQVLVDDEIVGVVWPFPTIFTGGMNPYLWRPIVAIGAFQVPTYLLNLTPFLGKFVDSKPHNVTFFVDYGIDFWPIDGNLLVFVDAKGKQTHVQVLEQTLDRHVVPKTTQQVAGLNANFTLLATRELHVKSRVTTSKGTKIYDLKQHFEYANTQEYLQDGEVGTFDSLTKVKSTLTVSAPAPQYQQGGGSGVSPLATVVSEEQYPLVGKTFYRQFTPSAYRLEADVSSVFRRSLSVSGPAKNTAFRYGFDVKDVSIALQGSAQAQTGLGGNGTTSATYAERSALDGCVSRRANAVNGVLLHDETIVSPSCK